MRKKELKSLVKKILAESDDNVFQLRPKGFSNTALATADDMRYAIERANAYLSDLEVLENRLLELDVLIQLSKESASNFLTAQGALREMRAEALDFVINEISESKDNIEEVNKALDIFEESAKEVNSTLTGKE